MAEESAVEMPGWRIEPSVAAELFWVLWGFVHPEHWPLEAAPKAPSELAAEVFSLRDAGLRAGAILVLADLAGSLTGADAEAVFAAVESPPQLPASLPLASEKEADRVELLRALELVIGDPQLRRRLVAVMRRAWALVESTWRSEGIQACEAAVARAREQLGSGARLQELVPHYGRREPWWPQIESAQANGRLLLVPTFFGGTFLAWDLPNTYLVGLQARPGDEVASLRQRASKLAARLKVLGDPTRLAIAALLARRPASVTELADSLAIAQPTVSMHLKLLREAGLVTTSREGGRMVQVADRAAVVALLDEARDAFRDAFREGD
ncbi:MAG TPA: metalloregulator ArsR/SmtB family transcription factor [Candidatus Dormibacteraeota bacterium]